MEPRDVAIQSRGGANRCACGVKLTVSGASRSRGRAKLIGDAANTTASAANTIARSENMMAGGAKRRADGVVTTADVDL